MIALPAITVGDDPASEDLATIDVGLGDANDAAAPLHEVRALASFARLASGVLIGGAVGRTWGECCELQQLWVDAAQRRQGLGERVLRAFERRAMERGCCTVYLETFSFQAPGLYRRLGYEVRHELTGFPHGIVKFLMLHRLGATENGP